MVARQKGGLGTQGGEYEPWGGPQTHQWDVRAVCADGREETRDKLTTQH